MLVQQFPLDDHRPAEILRLVGEGATGKTAAKAIGISRKTITRWRERVNGFGQAYDRAASLSRDGSEKGRADLELLVAAWTPGGLVEPEPEPQPPPEPAPLELQPEWVRERVHAVPELGREPSEPVGFAATVAAAVVEPDVLDATGAEITVQGSLPVQLAAPWTKVRPPTCDEWIAQMAITATDKKQPERVRVTAIAAVSSALFGGPGGRSTRPADLDDVTVAAAARGRDPGVPASVWDQARRSFLGPAPDADDSEGGEVVDLERATPG